MDIRYDKSCQFQCFTIRQLPRGKILQQLLLFGFPGEAEICDLVLESDQQLCEVVVELGALLQVALQLHEGVISSSKAFQSLFSTAALATALLQSSCWQTNYVNFQIQVQQIKQHSHLNEGLVEVLNLCNDLLLLPDAISNLCISFITRHDILYLQELE